MLATAKRSGVTELSGWDKIPFIERNKHELSSGTTRTTSFPIDNTDDEDGVGAANEVVLDGNAEDVDGAIDEAVDEAVSCTITTSPLERNDDTGAESSAVTGRGGKPERTS